MIISILHTNKYAQENKKEELGWVSIKFESQLMKETVPFVWKISLEIDDYVSQFHSRRFCSEIHQVHVENE